MLQAALAGGTAERRSVFELFGRRLPEGRRYGVVAGVGRALDAIEAFRFDDETLAALDGVVDAPTLGWLADYRFSGDIWGYAEGEIYFAALTAADRRGQLRRGGGAGDGAALDLQPRLGDRVGRLADDLGRRRPAVHRDGLAAHPRGGGGGGRAGGVRRRLREHLQPGGPAPLRRPDRRHQRALVHAAARHRGGRVPGAGQLPGRRHHAAGRHLRHRRGGPARRRGGRPGARRGPHRLR